MSLPAAPILSVASAASSLKQQRVAIKLADGVALKSSGIRVQSKCACAVAAGTSRPQGSKEDDDHGDGWKKEIFEDFSRTAGAPGRKSAALEDEEYDGVPISAKEEAAQGDWAAKARDRAIKAIEERELPVGALLDDKKKKRRKKKKKSAPAPELRLTKAKLERLEKIAKDLQERGLLTGDDILKESLLENLSIKTVGSGGEGFEGLAGLGNYWKSLNNSSAGGIRSAAAPGPEKSVPSTNRIVVPKNSDSSGPSGHSTPSRVKRQEDFDLNRRLLGAADAAGVLSVVGDVMEDRIWGAESPLSPFNLSTALHRIAKHMEAQSTQKSDRLAFARKKVMAQLVSAAIEALPNCTAQSISNISWALSKVGGYSLYWTEMDLLSQVAVAKLSHLEPQHIANIAGAFASMQHSTPQLFAALERRASSCHRKFQSQELAQLLWAFATLNHPATLLLDALDSECQSPVQRMGEKTETADPQSSGDDDMLPRFVSDSFLTEEILKGQEPVGSNSQAKEVVVLDFKHVAENSKAKQPTKWLSAEDFFRTSSLSELASLSWSYTVLGELDRPTFSLIWGAILDKGLGTRSLVRDLPCPSLQLSQLYQSNLSLQLEYPQLGLSLGEPLENLARKEWEDKKSTHMSTSVTQLNVEKLLVGMGRSWVAEYTNADYSLDAALVAEKICLEIDGPSHFARNTGAPLGHTMLKRRQLGAAGWTVLSIPYQEWDDQLGEQEQKLYLYNLLRGHL